MPPKLSKTEIDVAVEKFSSYLDNRAIFKLPHTGPFKCIFRANPSDPNSTTFLDVENFARFLLTNDEEDSSAVEDLRQTELYRKKLEYRRKRRAEEEKRIRREREESQHVMRQIRRRTLLEKRMVILAHKRELARAQAKKQKMNEESEG